jgi:hypothetical protein
MSTADLAAHLHGRCFSGKGPYFGYAAKEVVEKLGFVQAAEKFGFMVGRGFIPGANAM